MKYSVTLGWDEHGAEDFRDKLRLAAAAGWDRIGIGDSPPVFREMYVALTVAACETSVPLASMVQTPLGRNPALVASSVTALQELTDGRFTLVLGSGGSAPTAMGEPPTTLAGMRDYVTTLRDLLQGKMVSWGGHQLTPPRAPRPTPIHIATYGPKARRLAGAIGDGVVIGSGPRNPFLPQWVEQVREGAREAGRDPAEVEVWIMSRCALAESRAAALAEIKGSLASAARFAFQSPAEIESVPAAFQAPLRQFHQSYAVSDHTTWDGQNARRLDELGLTDFMAERFATLGSLEECREQLRAIPTDLGIAGVQLSAIVKNPRGVIGALPRLVGR